MRVVHVVPSLHREASGIFPAVIELANSLVRRGVSVCIMTLEPTASEILKLDAKVRLEVYDRFPFPSRLGVSFGMKSALTRIHERADVLHVHGLWMMPNIYPALVANGVPIIASPHGTLSQWSIGRSRLKKLVAWHVLRQKRHIQRASLFHATSEQEAEDIIRFGVRSPVKVIPNGVALPLIPVSRPDQRWRTLLFLGRIHPTKGVEDLLRAWQVLQARFEDWKLVIAGPGETAFLDDMKQLSRKLGLKNYRFCGPLYDAQKYQQIVDSDLYVLPSKSENFGFTIAEALGCGVPVVTTRETPWKMIEESGSGWWIESGSQALIGALEAAMSCSRQELRARGELGKGLVKKCFDWDVIGERFSEVYLDVVKKR